jgi:hypothetical protein
MNTHPFPRYLRSWLALLLVLGQWTLSLNAGDSTVDLRGVAVVPHLQSTAMRYRREPGEIPCRRIDTGR